ncbi:MAG: peroxidase-related enzyme [Persicimonas sp.]
MSWIDVIFEADAQGKLAEVYERISGARGKVSNIMRVHSLNPKAMQAHMKLYLSVMFGKSGLSREERELIATAVSVANDCPYCKNHHAVALDAYWEDRPRVERFMEDWRAVELSERQRAAVAYAVKLTESPGQMGEADVDALREAGLGDEEVLAVTLVTGYFNFVNRIAQGLGVSFSEEEMSGYKY